MPRHSRPTYQPPSPAAPAAGKPTPRLFDLAHAVAPTGVVIATIDGAARGNPGPAAYGAVFEDAAGKVVARLASKLGKATNNVAEYRALLAALSYARGQGWRALKVRTDSELLARQLQGRYKVKSADLKPLHEEAQQLIAALDYFAVEAVPRKFTRPADKLANAALDGRPMSKKKFSPVASPERSRGTSATGLKKLRVLYQNGVLKPLESLDLPEGTEVEISILSRKT